MFDPNPVHRRQDYHMLSTWVADFLGRQVFHSLPLSVPLSKSVYSLGPPRHSAQSGRVHFKLAQQGNSLQRQPPHAAPMSESCGQGARASAGDRSAPQGLIRALPLPPPPLPSLSLSLSVTGADILQEAGSAAAQSISE